MVIELIGVQFVQVVIRLRVQFGNNLHKWVFQKVSKLHEPVGRMQFELFEKHTTPSVSTHRGRSPRRINHVSTRCLKNGLIFHMDEVSELWRKTVVSNSHVFNLSNCSVVFKV